MNQTSNQTSKILIITGKQAYERVSKAVLKYENIDVYQTDISIAAFLTPNLILKAINKYADDLNIQRSKLDTIYDFILVTGLIRHDLKIIEEETGIKCYKSTREASDIPLLIENLDYITLSTKDYADDQISKYIIKEAEKELLNAEELPLYNKNSFNLKSNKLKNAIKIGNLKVGDKYPMRVLGEIVHTPWLSDKSLENKINYYLDSGADMIDLGMVSNEDNSKDLKRIISITRDLTDKPISVDTLNTKELIEAIKLDADMILSVDEGNSDDLIPYLTNSNTASVVLPTNYKTNEVPHTIDTKLDKLKLNVEKLLNNDLKVVADPILEPINNLGCNFTDSVIACKLFKEKYDLPMFFGIGNVTELFDVDSNGVNATLCAISQEVGGNILFTPESSDKCKYSIKELKIASKITFLAKLKNSLPKDLGYTLINYKDKKNDEEIYSKSEELKLLNKINKNDNKDKYKYDLTENDIIIAKENDKQVLDKGSFKIKLDRENSIIVAIYYEYGYPKKILKGKNPKEIYETALRFNMITKMDHAAYFGKELEKAEIALKIGKKYNQDFELYYNDFWDLKLK
ncbi:dihydropteroate synthase-like protein [Methanococcus voltae]|uniref:Dihydropteroate synthase-related protein n=1 Tax=Methanococcus voltae (strain ATCC BAA-1334 / A3) TaxID=456320 RepID=D7DUJ5_METV3|nr:dihydropteroate synthase-like protein [Methanococcus voltae]MCS3900605.1 dihydropteroate synthase-like protein [Methanococcus voltae]